MSLRFNNIIATGGIGSGILFQLDSNIDIGRNESRLAELTDTKDYCKQHIILYYIAKLLAPKLKVLAIGKVGDDSAGKMLLKEMYEAGIDTRFVASDSVNSTQYSVCAQYKDKSGYNITSSNSASDMVDEQYISDCIEKIGKDISDKSIVLAVPEVPLASRIKLLEAGNKANAFCVAAILSEEVQAFINAGGFKMCDLLAINEDEARAIASINRENDLSDTDSAYDYIKKINPDIRLIITLGEKGSFSFYRNKKEHIIAEKCKVASTAGAGDAYLSGVICGLAMGLPFQHDDKNKARKMIRATDLGAILAKKSVECKHTIVKIENRQDIIDKLKLEG